MQDLSGTIEELEKTRRELDKMTQTMLSTKEDRDMWKRLFEGCNKKQGDQRERLRRAYKQRSERLALTTAVEKVIPTMNVTRGQSPMERLTPRELGQTTETQLPATTGVASPWAVPDGTWAVPDADAFERGPVMIRKSHAYLVKEINLAENAGEKTAEFVNRVCQVTLEAFWTQNVKGKEDFDRSDSMLEGLGAGWTAFFMAKKYPSLSRYLIKKFLQVVVELSIVELLALIVKFGAQKFVKGPAILLTEGVQILR